MAKVYRTSLLGLRLVYKIRHHKGHGVHSPFVFDLINKVIEEKYPYHCYDDVKCYLEEFPHENLRLTKANLLSFRLINYFHAKKILELGAGNGVNTLCLSIASSNIKCISYEADAEKKRIASLLYQGWEREINQINDPKSMVGNTYDCVYINLYDYQDYDANLVERIFANCQENSFIIVKGIRGNKRNRRLWKYMSKTKNRTAMLDLFDIGILFFNKGLYRWKYMISF